MGSSSQASLKARLFDEVLGQFFYSRQIFDDCMQIEMQWADQGAIGVLHVPPAVTNLTRGTDYEFIRSGERLALPIALGLGLILAGLTDAHLILSGDKTAWKESWGALLDAPLGEPLGTA